MGIYLVTESIDMIWIFNWQKNRQTFAKMQSMHYETLWSQNVQKVQTIIIKQAIQFYIF